MLSCITEQKQVFERASHPFYWKPKLRIPEIFENEDNTQAFGQFLENCLNAGVCLFPVNRLPFFCKYHTLWGKTVEKGCFFTDSCRKTGRRYVTKVSYMQISLCYWSNCFSTSFWSFLNYLVISNYSKLELTRSYWYCKLIKSFFLPKLPYPL